LDRRQIKGAFMAANRRSLLTVLALIGVVGAAGYFAWSFSPRAFRGRLAYTPGMEGIPEDPPAATHLITASGTYELDFRAMQALDRNLHRELTDMNGKEVVVRGTLGVRRTLSGKEHPAIRVRELSLSALSTTSAPAPPTAPKLRKGTKVEGGFP